MTKAPAERSLRRSRWLWTAALLGSLVVMLVWLMGQDWQVGAGVDEQLAQADLDTSPTDIESPWPLMPDLPSSFVVPDSEPLAPTQLGAPAITPRPDRPPRVVHVTIIDQHDQPVAGAEVLVLVTPYPTSLDDYMYSFQKMGVQSPTGWDQPAQRLAADAHGRCRVVVESGVAEIYASSQGVGTSGIWKPWQRREEVHPKSTRAAHWIWVDEVTLRLLPQARIDGLVRDSSGRPVVGAPVFISREVSLRQDIVTKVMPLPPISTDGVGRFTLVVDAPSHIRLSAKVLGRTIEDVWVTVDPGVQTSVELVEGRVEPRPSR
jgi:hypothetical protein